ncbi:PilZ domain-containing protein [Halopseudomonas pachastrellae]|nr:PilZ domain-containing protein [Halopseudomonas pachastrellae]
MRWHCPGATQVQLEDAPAYATGVPEEMHYHQKRGAFRASVRRTADIAIELAHPERQRRFTAYLMDLSATGCKVRLEGDLSRSMTAGELYTPAILTLPDAGRVEVAAEVRHVHFREDANETHVGLMFKQPSALAQRSISIASSTICNARPADWRRKTCSKALLHNHVRPAEDDHPGR